jgi:hypothetical protein
MTVSMPASPGFVACRFGLETNTGRFESPLTKTVQRRLLGGARWIATYTLPPMNRQQAAPWQAFLLSLEGSLNTFYGYDPDAKNPRGIATGTPLVKNGSQTGSSLTTDGWTASQTGIMKAGDYFSVNGELKMMTADANSDGSGNATLTFKPALRASPSDNAVITVSNPTCTMILVDDGQAVWSSGSREGFYDSISFSAMETFS